MRGLISNFWHMRDTLIRVAESANDLFNFILYNLATSQEAMNANVHATTMIDPQTAKGSGDTDIKLPRTHVQGVKYLVLSSLLLIMP